jgi:hypothetical protein
MTVSRVVLGVESDGTIALRTSSVGNDAYTAADDGSAITFDSRWTDIVKLQAIGIASAVNAGGSFWRFQATFPDVGFIPFMEARRVEGNVVYDDFMTTQFPAGSYCNPTTNSFQSVGDTSFSSTMKMLFIIYKLSVPYT